MKKFFKYLLFIFVVLLVAFLAYFFFVLPAKIEADLNPVLNQPPYQTSEKARALHEKLFVADLHADSLLWNRNLVEKSGRGQVDVPRLLEGNVALQAFTVVTKSPRGLNIERNTDETDNIFWLALAQMQPLENLSSLTKRAVWQAGKLHEYAAKSGGKLVVIKTKGDLRNLVERRKTEKIVGGWLGIEGAHALDGKLENVDVLFDAGFRMMSPSHFFDNDIGGSAHGVEKYGLTEKGREMIRRMEAKGMLVDVAHASPKVIEDVLRMATKPVVVSHTGVKGTCDNQRNLSDEQLRGIAGTGGVIGIGFWDTAVCGEDARSIAKSVAYAANVVGVEHVALGSDFDGSVKVSFDTGGEALITEALLDENFSEEEIARIMGGNVLKLLSENLPD
ncbi:MAG TPA: dipeptidase [Pyrinomonadaceae bacterium]|jgi:microsomal dipeptidase-like Zn-dependent dipeptidase